MFAIDIGRRVIQCACGFAREWHGPETARLQGWHASYRERALIVGAQIERVWICAACWVPPVAPPASEKALDAGPVFTVPRAVLGVPERQLHGHKLNEEVDALRKLIRRLYEVDRAKGEGYLAAVLRVLGRSKKKVAREWRAWAISIGGKKLVVAVVGRKHAKELAKRPEAHPAPYVGPEGPQQRLAI